MWNAGSTQSTNSSDLRAGNASSLDTSFLTDLDRYAGYSAARAEAFPDKVPTSTAVATPALVFPGLLVEVEAVAEIGSG